MSFLLFIIGLAVGSFLNVVSIRYEEGGRLLSSGVIAGRSHCINCRKTLSWYELIPLVSFIIQKGKCKGCGYKLYWQYPIVELLSGMIFIAVYWKIKNFQFSIFNFQSSANFSITQLPNYLITNYYLLFTILIWLLVFTLLLLLSMIDFRHYIIPDSINLLLGFCGIILIGLNFFNNPAVSLSNPSIIQQFNNSFLGHYSLLFDLSLNSQSLIINFFFLHLLAALLGMILFGLIIVLSRGRGMGWGDFKLIGALGLIFGWPDILMVILSSFVIGAIISIFLIIRKNRGMKDIVPFGPFLAIGALATFLFGYQIMDLYFKAFSL